MAFILYKWFFILGLSLLNENALKEDAGTAAAHPFYLSVTEINHNASAKTLEISCKLFADDLESIIEKNYNTILDITTGRDKVHFDKYISDYMSKNLSLVVDGKAVVFTYVGYEVDEESAYVYLEVASVPAAKKIDVNNSILFDFINEQINILHVTINRKRKSSKLVYPASAASFNF